MVIFKTGNTDSYNVFIVICPLYSQFIHETGQNGSFLQYTNTIFYSYCLKSLRKLSHYFH